MINKHFTKNKFEVIFFTKFCAVLMIICSFMSINKRVEIMIALLIMIQVLSTVQENYDEDINYAFPVTISFRSVIIFSPEQVKHLDNINCTCKEIGSLDTHCSGSSCEIFPSKLETTAKYFKLKLTSIKTLRKDDFFSMGNVLGMDINANVKLEKIEAGCFRKMSNLRNLSLIANINLKHLDENVFEGLVNVEQMYFQKNGFNCIIDITHSLSPKFVPRLILLDMSESIFRSIKHDEFHPMKGSNLTQLNLVLCELEFLHPNCFLPLTNLNILLLGQNTFNITSLAQLLLNVAQAGIPINYLSLYDIGLRKVIPNQLMQAIAQSNITSLSLANNHFDYIYDTDFPHMPNLIDLDLRSNFIEDIAEKAFSKLPALKYLRLGENKFFSVPKGALVNQITYLDLAGNTIEGAYFNMQDAVFYKMSNLENLQLSYNTMFSLSNQSLIGLNNLLKLNLKRSDLHHIDEDTFVHLNRLEQLNLMDNPLNTFALNAGVFKGLNNLKVLLLGGCSITNLTITPNIFTYMPNLTYLGLERTNLRIIHTNQLQNLSNLQILNLADNKLAAWFEPILPNNLKFLFVQQNRISYLTSIMLDECHNLEGLYLDGNPLSCDCTLFPIVEYFEKNNAFFNKINDFVAKCIFPEAWRQKSIVDYLKHLSKNQNECRNNSTEIIMIILSSIIFLSVITFAFYCIYRKYCKKLLSVRHYNCNI